LTTTLDRRAALVLLAAGAAAPGKALAASFSFEQVKARAKALSTRAYVPPAPPPPQVAAMDYDAAQGVGFYREKIPLWGGDWGVELFPLSRGVSKAVAINLVENGVARPLRYDRAMFSSRADSPFRKLPAKAGFAGFRAISRDDRGEWLVFHGASYFRSPAPFGQYGLSARAIAADTYAIQPEEFPDWREVWLEKDAQGRLVVHALMESPGIVGAYRFVNDRDGLALTQTVEAAVFFRRAFDQMGFAPLTSMFWFGEDRGGAGPDWRPEVHDSDGLAMWTGAGERLWRPLSNPSRVVTSTFSDENPRGFGLIQRDRDFDHYHDDQANAERRPSAWIEPIGNWGKGTVRLVEIPTNNETNDNIVAFWTPEAPVKAGDAVTLSYRLSWTGDVPVAPGEDLARVVATRTGQPGEPGKDLDARGRKVAIEFQGANLRALREAIDIEADVTANNGEIRLLSHYPAARREDETGGLWRVVFDVAPTGAEPADVRVVLRQKGRALSETWTGLVFPAPAGN
jgi:glucans biosynthesis protein